MQRAMRQTLLGGSSVYSYLPARYPMIPRPNPSISVYLHPPPSSSAAAEQFSRVYIGAAEEPYNSYFYCNTEEFKRMLIEYKKDAKTYPSVMAARRARLGRHWEEDDRLMEKLKVFLVRDNSVYDGTSSKNLESKRGVYPPNPYGIRYHFKCCSSINKLVILA
ncbi:hypothetical protein MKW94_026656 [Papaver nudicaule]|uniref:Uncharacterized protein n=1 Tax=Papaver nudicaule TaxID=74823 RepID=A0AA41RS33_PAPNU|nr:hypothetical protein [Papaver nudicaule]